MEQINQQSGENLSIPHSNKRNVLFGNKDSCRQERITQDQQIEYTWW